MMDMTWLIWLAIGGLVGFGLMVLVWSLGVAAGRSEHEEERPFVPGQEKWDRYFDGH